VAQLGGSFDLDRKLRIRHLKVPSVACIVTGMPAPTPRRTDAAKLRQTISQLLDHLDAVEYSMDIFHRRDDWAELERAAVNFNDMLDHVDRLGDTIAEARGKLPALNLAPDKAA
jgi:hypothetical protein